MRQVLAIGVEMCLIIIYKGSGKRMNGVYFAERLEDVLVTIDRTLGTKRKRHIAGGVLLSVSLLFCSLAVTVIALKKEDKKNER